MPTYVFKCCECSTEYEDLVPKRGDMSPCPKCKSENVEKMVTAPYVIRNSGSELPCADGPCDFEPACGCGDGFCPHS